MWENAAVAPKADASEATDNLESRTAAVKAADATEDATLKKPTGWLTYHTSEKEIEAEALKKLSADASDLEPFKKPLPPGRLTGKKEGSRNSCEVHFSNTTKNVAIKGGGIRKSSGSDQDGFSFQNKTVAPYCTDADTASDNDIAVLAAVIEGSVAKAMHEGSNFFNREVMSWFAQYGTNYERFVYSDMLPAETKTKVLTMLQPPLDQVAIDEIVSDDYYENDSLFAKKMVKMRKPSWRS